MTIEVYKDKSGDWRWRIKSSNGNIRADSAEGYENHSDILDAIQELRASFRDAELVHLDQPRGTLAVG